MSPWDWTLHAFRHYADLRGRARRREFWWFQLYATAFIVVTSVVGAIIGAFFAQPDLGSRLGDGAALFTVVPSVAVTVRRLHDTGRSGWWTLVSVVPFVGLVLLFWCCLDSRPQNRWGPNHKAPDVTPPPFTLVEAR